MIACPECGKKTRVLAVRDNMRMRQCSCGFTGATAETWQTEDSYAAAQRPQQKARPATSEPAQVHTAELHAAVNEAFKVK